MQQIPKILHFVWVGKNPKPALVLRCIDSWKKYCPDYKIIEWNEENFDIESHQYVKEAYGLKKWAFVSDYIRLYALKEYGGVYVDSDLEIYKPIDIFLEHSAFTGFESPMFPITAIMGAAKNHPWINDLLKWYDTKHFIKDGVIDYTANVHPISDIMCNKYGIKRNNLYQIGKEDLHVYPDNVFCANATVYGYKIPEGCYTRHHFNATWEPLKYKPKRYFLMLLKAAYYVLFDWKKLYNKVLYKIKYHNKLK